MRLCKSSLITKLIILILMIYAVVTIVALQPKISALQDDATALEAQIAAVQQSNLELQDNIDALGTDESAVKLARERLNMIADGERIYIDASK